MRKLIVITRPTSTHKYFNKLNKANRRWYMDVYSGDKIFFTFINERTRTPLDLVYFTFEIFT